MEDKYKQLIDSLRKKGKVAIAFSGGVDSSFLLDAAQQALGEMVVAYTVKTPYVPDRELEEAIAFCRDRRIPHRIISMGIPPAVIRNPENRCYLCKKHLFSRIKEEASREGILHVLDGSNADDSADYRPGMPALTELGIGSPLLENKLSKAEIREFSRERGLPTAEKPAYACLLTRLPHGRHIRRKDLVRTEKAESYLISLGYDGCRVRNHEDLARIELPADMVNPFFRSDHYLQVAAYFRTIGYRFITLDLEGYRTGSYNEVKTHDHEP